MQAGEEIVQARLKNRGTCNRLVAGSSPARGANLSKRGTSLCEVPLLFPPPTGINGLLLPIQLSPDGTAIAEMRVGPSHQTFSRPDDSCCGAMEHFL